MKKYLTFLALYFLSSSSNTLDLDGAVISRGQDTIRNDAERLVSPIITNVVENSGGKPGRGVAYTNFGGGNEWYRLYSEMVLAGVDASTQTLIGRWPLTRWSYEINDAEVAGLYEIVSAQEGDVWHRYINDRYQNAETIGCIANSPMRYGDIENDGTSELVLFLGKGNQQVDWVVFSPEAEKIIFSARLALQDFQEAPSVAPVHYLSLSAGPKALIGKRVYAKLYFGDFDQDNNADILVWRKYFQSLSKESSSEKGFELKVQNYRHYEFSQGEYLPQPTEESQMQAWLSGATETWSSGYPSTSECAGQEGQLIPEMHDPLLNDPDVLIPVPVVTP